MGTKIVTASHTGKDRKREYLPQKMAEKVALSTVLHVGSVTYYYSTIYVATIVTSGRERFSVELYALDVANCRK